MQDQLQVFMAEARRDLATLEVFPGEGCAFRAAEVRQFVNTANILRPVFKRLRRGKFVLDFAVVVELAFLEIKGDHLPRAQAAFFAHVLLVDDNHAGLGPDNKEAVIGDGKAHRAKPVAVQTRDNPTAIRGCQRGRAIPWLHHRVGIGIHGAVCFRHAGLVGPGFRYQQGFHHRRGTARPHHNFKHSVKRGAIGSALWYHRLDVFRVFAKGD